VQTDLDRLDGITDDLPFRLDDAEAVNESYSRLVRHPDKEIRRTVDLWTYCYIRRYFLVKFLRESGFRVSELEQTVEKTYRKVERGRAGIERPDRYAQWVSVVCRNTYVNFVRRRTYVMALDEMIESPVEMPEIDTVEDPGRLYMTIVHAIDRLPAFLKSCARMRFIEDLSYEEISRITGISIPTVRAYVHKICVRFRQDEALQSFTDQYN
jgi:RNA polymerase sigma factor (sigma-70 family)